MTSSEEAPPIAGGTPTPTTSATFSESPLPTDTATASETPTTSGTATASPTDEPPEEPTDQPTDEPTTEPSVEPTTFPLPDTGAGAPAAGWLALGLAGALGGFGAMAAARARR